MKQHKTLLLAALLLPALYASAQDNGSNSPYSRYGFGLLNPRTSSYAAASGATIAMQGGREVNFSNPASYAAIDSLTFLFDVGLSLQNANLNEGGRKVNARNASIDYVTAGFRAAHNLGFSLGLMPYSTIGYKMVKETLMQTSTGEVTETDSYNGSGGLHEAFVGIGWRPFKGFSVGMNAGYFWGANTHTVTATFSDAGMSSRIRTYDSDIRSYKLDFGLQYMQRLNERNALTLGLTYGLGHNINSTARYYDQTLSGSTYSGDTISCLNAFQLPHTFGAGLMWYHRNRLRLGVDYTFEKWSNVKSPVLGTGSLGGYSYTAQTGQYTDRHRIAVGGEYVPDNNSIKWSKHIRYRAGLSYTTPYTRLSGQDGPSDLTASIGVGLPIMNAHSNRCILNFAVQYERVSPKVATQVKEQYIRFCLGLSFNEEWFRKWRAR